MSARGKILWIAMLFPLLSGCLTPNHVTVPQRYVLQPDINVSQAKNSGKTLGIRPFMVAQPYRLPLVYQEGARLGVYPNEEWAEQPGDMVTRAVSDAIMATGRFQDVGNAADMARPDLILTGELRKFHEGRSDTSVQAVISLHLELREARGTNAYWVETLTFTHVIEDDTPIAFVEGMNGAVDQLIQHVAEKLSTLIF